MSSKQMKRIRKKAKQQVGGKNKDLTVQQKYEKLKNFYKKNKRNIGEPKLKVSCRDQRNYELENT